MIKDEARFSVMCEISMALKSPKLQQGFEIICKNLSELEKENAELNDKLNNLASVAEVRLGMWQKYEKENKWYKEMCEDMKADMCSTDNTALSSYLMRILKKYGEIV